MPLRHRPLGDIRSALLAGAVIGIFATCINATADPDMWWHIRVGEWILDHHAIPSTELFAYTTPGASWTAHSWLFEVVFALLYRAGGILLVATAVALLTWSGYIALAFRARSRGASAPATALALIVAAKAGQTVMGTRTQMASFALLCWVLWLAERHLDRGGRGRFAMPAIFMLWANLHAGFVAGLAVIAGLIGIATFDAWRRRREAVLPLQRIRQLGVVLALSLAACCVNPYGPALIGFALNLTSSNLQALIVEWGSPNFHDSSLVFLLFFIAGLVCLGPMARRPPLSDLVFAAAGIGMTLIAVRNAALLVALALPLWALGVDGLGRTLGLDGGRLVPGRLAVVTSAAALLAGLALAGSGIAVAAADASGAGVARMYPACVATTLHQAPRGTRVLVPYFDGGYIIFEDWPQIAGVYAYGENQGIGGVVLANYVKIMGGGRDALALLAESHTDVVVAPLDSSLGAQLDASPQWQRARLDDHGLGMWTAPGAEWPRQGCTATAA